MLLSELKSVEAPLGTLMSKELPIGYSFRLTKLIESISTELKRAEKFRIDLITKYGVADGENLTVPNENIAEFTKEYELLMSTEVDIVPVAVPLDVLVACDIKMSVQDVNTLVSVGFITE